MKSANVHPADVRRRRWLFALTFAAVVGSYGLTFGYAWYLRSAVHHRDLARQISEYLGMPVSFERLEPLSFHGQALDTVSATLWDEGPQVFACSKATWLEQSVGDEPGYHLHLRDGWLVVGTAEWRRYEYERLIAAGLQHDFADLGLRRVRLENFDLRWIQGGFEVRAGRSSGVIDFSRDGEGVAQLICRAFNGETVDEPISISARFTPGPALDFRSVQLRIPRTTLESMRLDDAVGGPLCSGELSGEVRFTHADQPRWSFQGTLTGADLAEVTRRLPGGPYCGTANVDVARAEASGGRLLEFDASGELAGILIGQIWPGLDPQRTAKMNLAVHEARFNGGSVEHLSLSGSLRGMSLQRATELWGQGTITGVADVTIHSLLVVDDALRYADVQVEVRPPEDGPGYVDRRTLAVGVQELLGMDVASVLPERVEYSQFGVRLKLEGEQLRVLGTHGWDGQTILTVKVFGREIGLVRQPQQTFTTPDPMAWLRTQSRRYHVEDVRAWWSTGRFAAPPNSSEADE